MSTPMLQYQFEATLSVGGRDYGTWSAFEGGGRTSEPKVARPGGMKPGIAVPGIATTDQVTLTKQFTTADAMSVFHELDALVGTGVEAVPKLQALGTDSFPIGVPIVRPGVVSSVTPPSHDSESEEFATVQVVITPHS